MAIYVGDKRYAPYIGDKRREVRNKKALPYDAEIEYLESTGTQWIDLGFKATDNIAFDIKINRANNNIRFDCGSEEGWTTKIIRLLIQEGNTVAGWRYGNTSTSGNTITNSSNCVGDLRIECDKKVAKIYNLTSGVNYSKTITGDTPILTPGNFLLFGYTFGSEASVASASSGCRLYSAKVVDTNVNLDLIPVRVGQVGYLYDRNSGTLFGKSGEGNFVLGQDRNYIEYLESTGTSGFYINTAIGRPATFTSAEIQTTVQFLSTSGRQIHGATDAFYFGVNAGKWECDYQEYVGTADTSDIHIMSKKMTISSNQNTRSASLDGSQIYSKITPYYISDFNVPIGIFSHNSSSTIGWHARIYSEKIYINEILVKDMVPIRIGQVGYMYDKISGIKYGNSGTGLFVLGPDKN